ncbi:MAG TPA: sensor histidine kinase [Pseudonocardiaceae bacterium]|nr:sensor histidine kinase [Pseudonocardiaceae bacterium]
MTITRAAESPADRWRGPAAAFEHPALFYRNSREYLHGTLEFVNDGLSRGDAVLIAVPPDKLELIASQLGRDTELVRLVDMAQAGRNPSRILGGVLRAFADDHAEQWVRIVAEPIWPDRSAAEYAACAQHEALINRAFAGRAVSMLCPYDTQTLDSRALIDAVRTHPVVLDGDRTQDSTSYAPEAVLTDYNQPLPAPLDATEFTVGATQLRQLRTGADDVATAAGLDEERRLDWTLALTELATNSIEHSHGYAEVRMFTDRGELVGQVRDAGEFTDPLAGRHPAQPGQVRGRGLMIVHDLADLVRLHTRPGATTVEVRFRIG